MSVAKAAASAAASIAAVSLIDAALGLDHVILAVPDLAAASTELGEKLGLSVQPGGSHPGWGTHNAIVRFGVIYLELIAVNDRELARRRPRGERMLQAVATGPGWSGYALGAADAEAAAAAILARGLNVQPPEPGRRTRPDGVELRWRSANLDDGMWGGSLPFIIQHETPAETRASWTPAAGHPLGAIGIKALGVAVDNLAESIPTYTALLGGEPSRDRLEYAQAERATWRLMDGTVLRLMAPETAGQGVVAEHLSKRGPSLFIVGLAVRDLGRAIDYLAARRLDVSEPYEGRTVFLRQPVLGAAFALIESKR
jgi:4-hydroxyphenylpyruvate dioxygenase-like putative hemolysin